MLKTFRNCFGFFSIGKCQLSEHNINIFDVCPQSPSTWTVFAGLTYTDFERIMYADVLTVIVLFQMHNEQLF